MSRPLTLPRTWTAGSLNYLTRTLFDTKPPSWAKGKPIHTEIGAHVFLTA